MRDVRAHPGDLQCEGKSLGRAGAVVSPDLPYPGSSDVSPAGGSGEMPVPPLPFRPAFPRRLPAGIPEALASPILTSLSRRRLSAPRLTVSRSAGCGRPGRWGSGHRRGRGACASGENGDAPRTCFRGCVLNVPALTYRLYFLCSGDSCTNDEAGWKRLTQQ